MATAAVAGGAPLILSSCASGKNTPDVPEKEKGLRFVFQGDSISDGNRGRNEDPNHILGHGYVFSIASRIGADFPEAGFSFFNRGISGNTISDLKLRWQNDTLALEPDVLSVLVGINDVAAIVEDKSFQQTVDRFEQDYHQLLQEVEARYPAILFVLGIPFVFPVGDRKEKWEKWSDLRSEHAEAVRRIAKDHHAILVDYQLMFEKASMRFPSDYWIWDGIHPTVFGHELMTREWINQVGKKLNFLKFYNYSS